MDRRNPQCIPDSSLCCLDPEEFAGQGLPGASDGDQRRIKLHKGSVDGAVRFVTAVAVCGRGDLFGGLSH